MSGVIIENIRVSGETIKCTEKESSLGLMERNMLVSHLKIS